MLKVENICKTFNPGTINEKKALDGLSLHLAPGDFVTVIGGVIYYLVYVFVLWLKFPANDMKLLTAIVVAVFLAVPYLQSKRKNSFRHAGAMAKAREKQGVK